MARAPKVNTISVGEVEVDEVVSVEEAKAEEVAVIAVDTAPEKKVKVKIKNTFKQYIGDRWHYFRAGDIMMVAPNVRDILMQQGSLDVLP